MKLAVARKARDGLLRCILLVTLLAAAAAASPTPSNPDTASHTAPDNGSHRHARLGRDIPWYTVLFLSCVTALCTGFGALPFFFMRHLSKRTAGLVKAIACGVMLAASFDLVHEGQPYSGPGVLLGLGLGTIFIQAMHRWLDSHEDVSFAHLKGADARRSLMIMGIMVAHAFGEGCGVGVSFCGRHGWRQGLLITIAMGVHNVPEGLAVATTLVTRGVDPWASLGWTLLSNLPQALVALPSYLFVSAFTGVLPVALGFAAGCMVWMVFAELLPDALADAPSTAIATSCTLSALWLEATRMLLESMTETHSRLAGISTQGLAMAAARPAIRSALFSAALVAVAAALAVGALQAAQGPQHPPHLGSRTLHVVRVAGCGAALALGAVTFLDALTSSGTSSARFVACGLGVVAGLALGAPLFAPGRFGPRIGVLNGAATDRAVGEGHGKEDAGDVAVLGLAELHGGFLARRGADPDSGGRLGDFPRDVRRAGSSRRAEMDVESGSGGEGTAQPVSPHRGDAAFKSRRGFALHEVAPLAVVAAGSVAHGGMLTLGAAAVSAGLHAGVWWAAILGVAPAAVTAFLWSLSLTRGGLLSTAAATATVSCLSSVLGSAAAVFVSWQPGVRHLVCAVAMCTCGGAMLGGTYWRLLPDIRARTLPSMRAATQTAMVCGAAAVMLPWFLLQAAQGLL